WILFLILLGGIFIGALHFPAESISSSSVGDVSEITSGVKAVLSETNWIMITSWFLFYFLGGYFLYAALYAAVGSLVNEDAQESQQFTLPITAPIILGFVIMTSAIRDPNSSLA